MSMVCQWERVKDVCDVAEAARDLAEERYAAVGLNKKSRANTYGTGRCSVAIMMMWVWLVIGVSRMLVARRRIVREEKEDRSKQKEGEQEPKYSGGGATGDGLRGAA